MTITSPNVIALSFFVCNIIALYYYYYDYYYYLYYYCDHHIISDWTYWELQHQPHIVVIQYETTYNNIIGYKISFKTFQYISENNNNNSNNNSITM